MVGFAESDERGTVSAGHGNAGLVETMMTADSLQLTAYGLGPCRTVRSRSIFEKVSKEVA